MTVLLEDAKQMFMSRGGQFNESGFVREIVYADDTLLIGSEVQDVQLMMECVSACGAQYGLAS